MKNKGFIALVFVFTALIGGAFMVADAAPALAYHDSYDYGYDYDYGYGDYGYDYDYGYGDYGYDYDYGYGYDECDYGCGGYDYDYDDCYYGCGGYDYYDDCDYGCGDYYDYDDCDYGCDEDYEEPTRNENVNTNINNNTNNIVIRNYTGGHSESTREREREEDHDPLICTPASQTAGVNQSVTLRVTGGSGTYAWNAPGSQNINGRGDSVSLRYPTSGLKTITVSSRGESATCFVQVTGGQVLAEFIEFPNTGAGGIRAAAGSLTIIGIISAVLSAAFVFFVRRAVLA